MSGNKIIIFIAALPLLQTHPGVNRIQSWGREHRVANLDLVLLIRAFCLHRENSQQREIDSLLLLVDEEIKLTLSPNTFTNLSRFSISLLCIHESVIYQTPFRFSAYDNKWNLLGTFLMVKNYSDASSLGKERGRTRKLLFIISSFCSSSFPCNNKKTKEQLWDSANFSILIKSAPS